MPAKVTPEPPVYVFRVRVGDGPYDELESEEVWRDIEIAANQTLQDLGQAIPQAFDFDDPHLWSFFMSGIPWDEKTEYKLDPTRKSKRSAHRHLIRDVSFPNDHEALFLFDFGDEWYFGVSLTEQRATLDRKARYPRVAAQEGKAPPQYPDLDEDDEEDE